jgi:hypothetical protein
MIELVTLEELRQTRRTLAEAQGEDPQRYAAMLAQVSRTLPGTYVKQTLLPQVPPDDIKVNAS